MNTLSISVFLLIYVIGLSTESESRLMLSPSGLARVCPGGELAITCTTDRSFLEWNITTSFTIPGLPYRTRLISVSDQTVDPLVLNIISFDFSVHTLLTNGSLVSVLSVTDVSVDLNGTGVRCTDIGNSLAETSTLTVTIQVIRTDHDELDVLIMNVYSSSLEVETEVSNYGIDDITVTLSWTQQEHGITYNISVVPQTAIRFNPGPNIQLIGSYNTRYIVSIVRTLCGHDIPSTVVELNYVKCKSLLHLFDPNDGLIRINGYSDPALKGTNVTFECSSSDFVLIGPNTTTCMENGEWESDPRHVVCVADCGVPMIDGSLNLTYNSTLEGSEVMVQCDGFVVTALCHRNGSWSPQLTNDSVCNFRSIVIEPPVTTGMLNYNIIIIVVVVSILVLLTFIFTIIVCISFYLKYKWSSKASDSKQSDVQPTQPVYETVMDCTAANLMMTENVAYALVRSINP